MVWPSSHEACAIFSLYVLLILCNNRRSVFCAPAGMGNVTMQGAPEPPESAGIRDTGEAGSASDPRYELTFVSHAGEDKEFVRDLLRAMEGVNCAAFFDDEMAVGTSAELEMKACAEKANQAVVVLSRPFLTKMWPMLELGLFIQNKVKIYPLFYGITPDKLLNIVGKYDR